MYLIYATHIDIWGSSRYGGLSGRHVDVGTSVDGSRARLRLRLSLKKGRRRRRESGWNTGPREIQFHEILHAIGRAGAARVVSPGTRQ